MNLLASFLSKYRQWENNNLKTKEEACRVLNRLIGSCLTPTDLVIKEGIIYLPSQPALKTEVFMRKQLILDQINATFSVLVVRDIK